MTNIKLLVIFLAVSLSFVFVSGTEAKMLGDTSGASLTISPQTGTFNINDTFKINIYVDTHDQFVNVATIYLKYDKNYFQAMSIDTTESIFSMVAEAKIDASSGQIRIALGIPTPGVKTTSGLVASVIFKALANVTPGADNLIFDFSAGNSAKTAVFLNDGKGTNILTGVSGAKFKVGEGGPITYPDDTLLKVTGGTKIYVISDNRKHWIPTAEIFNSNGYKWADIIEVAQSVVDSFLEGPNIVVVGGSILDGAMIRVKGDIDVYIVKYIGAKKFKRLILSPSVFNSYKHLKWGDVKVVDQSVADSFVTSNLVRAVNDQKVYKLTPSGDTGQRAWIKTSSAFERMGMDWDSIYEINQVDRDSYVDSVSID